MRKFIITAVAMAFCVTLFAQPALAGSKQRHIWQGVAIGAGAVLLGQAIFHERRVERYPSRVTVIERPVYRDPVPVQRTGYWKSHRVWVPAEHETVWNPGHYNAYDQWISGRWIKIETRSGFWQKDRVWVSCR